MNSRLLTLALVAGLMALPSAAQACSVCMGDSNSKTAGAINAAIFLMLGAVALMLSSFGLFAFYLSRRAGGPTPPHAEIEDDNSDDFS